VILFALMNLSPRMIALFNHSASPCHIKFARRLSHLRKECAC
jgi:hypothetical protein